jgi:manganese-dependent inorganic pyrophosphatase
MTKQTTKIVYVIGHKNPDTDSICSAIGYAYFKNIIDKRFLHIPVRAGKINEETRFVLEKFGVPVPNEIHSLMPTVGDLEFKKPIFISERDSIQTLAFLLRETGVESVPVVDESGRVNGIVGLKDIAKYYMDSVDFTVQTKMPISLDILVNTLDGRVISNSKKVEFLNGRVLIASMQKGTILNRVQKGDIVITGDQYDIHLDLIRSGCSAVIITDGMPISSDIISFAEEYGTLILSSPHHTFATVQLITMSKPVASIMCSSIPSVGIYTPVSDLKKKMLESDYRSAVVVDNDSRLIGFITRTDLMVPVRKRVILVDHNEISQAADNIEEAEIMEIIDHHRVGGISTIEPIYVYNDPIGSTCTAVAGTMFLYQIDIPKEIAGLLLSGILSDTLLLTISTTTERDCQVANKLAELAGVPIKKYGEELFYKSINIKDKTIEELIAADFKEFMIEGKKLGISQMMVPDYNEIDNLKEAILSELEKLRIINKYDLTVLLVTNPVSSSNEYVFLRGETWIVEKAFDVKVKDGTCILPCVMSRKKDFIPAIGHILSFAETV